MEITIRSLALSAFVFSDSVQAQHLTPGIPADTALTSVSPLVIDGEKDVVIQNVQVSNPKGSCIQIKHRAQNIIIENSRIGPCSRHGIEAAWSYDIDIRNSYIHDTGEVNIMTYKVDGLNVYNNRLERGTSLVHNSRSYQVTVTHNKFLNAKGPHPAGHFVVFDSVAGGGNRINCNVGENVMGQGKPEEAIILYKSSGDAADPIQIVGNKIKGGGPSTIGGGIVAGDSGGGYALITDNILVDPGQVGIGIGGHDTQALNNLIYARKQPFTNVGLYVWNGNNHDPNCYSNTVQGNSVNWTNKAGSKNPNWDGDNCGPIAGWDDNTWYSNIGPEIEYLTIPSC
jgi:hypothetical protein